MSLRNQFITGVWMFLVTTMVQAQTPLWSFTPITGFSPQQTVRSTDTAIVKYTITNNSSKPHNLVIKPQKGISQMGPCVLGPSKSTNSSCMLVLNITGSELTSKGILGGPVLCQSNSNGTPNPNQCYRPSQDDELHIVLTTQPPVITYIIDAVGYYFDDSFIQPPNNTYPFSGNGIFSGVSCTGNFCTAVGYYSDDNFNARPLLAISQNSGTTWTYPESTTAPIFTPNNTYAFNSGNFASTSCTASSCINVGAYVDSATTLRPLLALSQDSGTTWTFPESITAPVFTPNNTYPFSLGLFSGASCSGSSCVTVGFYFDSNSVARPLLASSQNSGATWAYPESITAPVFTPNDTYFFAGGSLVSASCAGGLCVAVGNYSSFAQNQYSQRPLLAYSQDSGTSWIYPESITIPIFTPNDTYPFHGSGVFSSTSCSDKACIAVGSYYDDLNTQRPLLALSQDSGTTWTYPESITAPVFTPNNTYPFSVNGGLFTSASCTGSSCTAVGYYYDENFIQRPLLALSLNSGTNWTYPESITAPVFTPSNTYPFSVNGGLFTNASCTGNSCTAVGYYNDESFTQRPLLAFTQDSGITWTYPESITAPVFTPNNSYPFNNGRFSSVSTTARLWFPKSLQFLYLNTGLWGSME
ncbi:MAG: hypothetical protein HYX60_05440 [Legionella longbeachae]|nr:hypothetical protein [Legionella longbeachae]